MPAQYAGNATTKAARAKSGGGFESAIPLGVIFETNWANDTGFTQTNAGLWDETTKPEGFTATIASGNSEISVVSGAGVGGSNALRLKYGTTESQPVITLLKHLSGDINTGYGELYIRYQVKFPDNYKFGDGTGNIPYWKWLRLHQNISPTDRTDWTENQADTYYMVWTMAGSDADLYGLKPRFIFAGNAEDGTEAERANGSAGGPHAAIDWYVTGNPLPHSDQLGYFEHMPGWDIDWSTDLGRFESYPTTGVQTWHTIEIRVKAASAPGADDGVIQMWFDGVDQGIWQSIADKFAPDTGPFTGVPTAVNGSGWNMMYLFDNMTQFNADFDLAGVDGYIDVNDVVVSETRIGHDYVAGSVT